MSYYLWLLNFTDLGTNKKRKYLRGFIHKDTTFLGQSQVFRRLFSGANDDFLSDFIVRTNVVKCDAGFVYPRSECRIFAIQLQKQRKRRFEGQETTFSRAQNIAFAKSTDLLGFSQIVIAISLCNRQHYTRKKRGCLVSDTLFVIYSKFCV